MNNTVNMLYGAESALQVKNSVCVVIDVLRASSTIITALAHGYEQVVPISNLDLITPEDVCAGEYFGSELTSTTFDNSPIQIINSTISTKQLYLITTNGTRCLLALNKNNIILIGALLNGESIALQAYKIAKQHKKPIVLLCCGYQNILEDDDYLVASYIASQLSKLGGIIEFELKPSVNIKQSLLATPAALRLIKLGKSEDVLYCCQQDKYLLTPYYDPKAQAIVLPGSVF